MPLASLAQAGASIVNQAISSGFDELARKRNFHWNEKAANSADKRQRKQYHDLYSPKAQLEQYKAAGLSPSMMMSGGQSAVGGSASGNISSSVQGPYAHNTNIIDPLRTKELELMESQINNLNEDTITKELYNELQKLSNNTYKEKWNILNGMGAGVADEQGMPISLKQIVDKCENYEEFAKYYKKYFNAGNSGFIASHEGQKTLQEIYQTYKQFSNDITIIENSKENAELMLNITKLLNNDEFASNSAEVQKQELTKVLEESKLTEREKRAFNNILDKAGNGTFGDLATILLIMLKQNTHASFNASANRSDNFTTTQRK